MAANVSVNFSAPLTASKEVDKIADGFVKSSHMPEAITMNKKTGAISN